MNFFVDFTFFLGHLVCFVFNVDIEREFMSFNDFVFTVWNCDVYNLDVTITNFHDVQDTHSDRF